MFRFSTERQEWLERDKLTTLVRRAAPSFLTGVTVILLLAAATRGALKQDTPPMVLILLLGSAAAATAAAMAVRRISARTTTLAYCIWSILTVLAISVPLSIVAALTGDHQAIVFCMFGAILGSVFWLNLWHAIAAQAAFVIPPLIELAILRPGIWEWRIALQVALTGTFVAFSLFLLMHFYHRQTTLMSQELQTRASIDGLTQVFNKSAWYAKAEGRLRQARIHETSTSLIFLDLDNFKQINDEMGHLTGDLILRRLSEVVREQIDAQHLIGRFGGDEFVVLLADTGQAACGMAARRLERAIRASIAAGPQAVGVSLGMATWDGAESLDNLVLRADVDMFARKRERAGAPDIIGPGVLPA
jgi:diguanylate cyclase (GGDEF)-like protein